MPKIANYPSLDLIKKRGKNVSLVRKKHGLKREEFAEMIGYTRDSLAMIEQGHRNLTEASADRICELFPEIRKNWLLGYDEFMTDQHEYKKRIEQAVDEMQFQAEFDTAAFRATQLVILSTLEHDGKNPRIDEDGESIIYDDYAPTGKTSDEYGSETELKPFRISSGWIDNFSGEVAAYAEFLFNRKALNYRAEFEEVK